MTAFKENDTILSILIGINDSERKIPLHDFERIYDKLVHDAKTANPKLLAVPVGLGVALGQGTETVNSENRLPSKMFPAAIEMVQSINKAPDALLIKPGDKVSFRCPFQSCLAFQRRYIHFNNEWNTIERFARHY